MLLPNPLYCSGRCTSCLQAAGVYLPLQIETQTFEMQSHAMSIRYSRVHESSFGDLFNDIGYQALEAGKGKSIEVEDTTDNLSATPQSAGGQAGFMVEAMVIKFQHRAFPPT